MIEFGSDFHYISSFNDSFNTLHDFYQHANYYADGRQALIHLYHSQGWQRLWVPEYFCYDVIASLNEAGLNLMFYPDWPGYHDDGNTLDNIQRNDHFSCTDAVLRVNYFGMRSRRNAEHLSVAAVVEDHTHDLIGDWTVQSTADWCIASLRKTLPIPEGGMLWSPKGLPLPEAPERSAQNEKIASIRWEAMKLKADYLAGEEIEKAAFRAGLVNTEEYFDHAPVCSLDNASLAYLESFNVQEWYGRKRDNWNVLQELRKDGVHLLRPENVDGYPFSLILLFDSIDERDRVRKALIDHQVYPAILWNIPVPTDGEIFHFSRGMLSVHCDGRYSTDDILQLKSIIESVL